MKLSYSQHEIDLLIKKLKKKKEVANINDAKNKWDDIERGFCENTGTGQDMWQCHI